MAKRIYMIAICGTGMSSVAGLLKESGYEVSGSDTNVYPPVSTLLARYGIEIKPGYKKENIPAATDLVIIGNAVSKNNEEVQAVMERGIPYMSFPQALAEFFLKSRKSLVVTGTHGKTTTTSLLGWTLHACGLKPGFMVGGWLKNFDSNYQAPQGGYFVSEGDEYDTAFFDKGPKFLHYRPYAAVLTGIEFDHADIYRDLAHLKSSFIEFAGTVDPAGFLLVEDSGVNLQETVARARCVVETYGFAANADWRILNYRHQQGQGCFSLAYKGVKAGDFSVPLIGRHNAQNCAAVVAMAIKLGLAAEAVNAALAGFLGVKRRQEIVGEKSGVIVMDDFAHHPTAIHKTLEAVREAWPDHGVWAVFEPRSATSRRNAFQKEFPPSFLLADRVVIGGLFAPEKLKPEERLDLDLLLRDLRALGKEAYVIPDVQDIIELIRNKARPKDILLIMSSGGFGGIHQQLLQRL